MMSWSEEMDWSVQDSIEVAIHRLKNDEHISAAIKADILEAALVVPVRPGTPLTRSVEYEATRYHNPQVLPPRPHNYAVPGDRKFCIDTQDKVDDVPDLAIEAEFLQEVLAEADDMLASLGHGPLFAVPYILDIDLDYFLTHQSLQPADPSVFHSLLQNALAITIAREPRYVISTRREQTVTAETFLAALREHLVTALGAQA